MKPKNPKKPGPKPQPMNQQEANEYVQRLLRGQLHPENPLEVEALNQLRRLTMETGQKNNRLQALTNEIERLKIDIQKSLGRSEAYINLLVSAENSRRVPGLSLDELKKKMGAHRLQVVDGDGEVVGDTDPEPDPEELEKEGTAEPQAEEENPDGAPEGKQG